MSDLRRYVIAVAAVAASLLARYALQGLLGDKVPFLQFYPAIVAAAWIGGLGPGLAATALSSVIAMVLPSMTMTPSAVVLRMASSRSRRAEDSAAARRRAASATWRR